MSIIISTSKIKACQYFYDLCDVCGYERAFTDTLWGEILLEADIYDELVYYLENHTFKDGCSIEGYSLSDIYFFQMNKYNLIREIGKNPADCNKERMVINSFRMFLDMKKDPAKYVERIEAGRGEDRL